MNSFTGLVLAKELIDQEHNVFALTSGDTDRLSIEQLNILKSLLQSQFFKAIKFKYQKPIISQEIFLPSKIDVVFLHGFNAKHYQSFSLDPIHTAQESVQYLTGLPPIIKNKGCKLVCYTGTYFENQKLSFQTPYTVSKSIAWLYIKHLFKDFSLLRYLFSNPIGVGQSRGLSHNLLEHWSNDKIYEINKPLEVRDNIPVEFMIQDYIKKAFRLYKIQKITLQEFSPSYYIRTNLNFTKLIKNYIQQRYPDTRCQLSLGLSRDSNIIKGQQSIRRHFVFKERSFWKKYIDNYFIK